MCLAFDHFNKALFANELPQCLITVQREKNVMGYFSAERWGNKQDKRAHEIALNPAYFADYKLIEVFQTLVHEQCHLWQHVSNTPDKRPRRSYHNKQWADKMEGMGLMPSDTGQPGGKRTGQKMNDYPIPGGLFIRASESLIRHGFELSWIDLLAAPNNTPEPVFEPLSTPGQPLDFSDDSAEAESIDDLLNTPVGVVFPDVQHIKPPAAIRSKLSKTKYSCGCDEPVNIWGKPGLKVRCELCEGLFTEQY